MAIDSTMMPSTDMAQPITSSTAYGTDSTSGMGTAGKNMDSVVGKLYEDVKQGSSNPLLDSIRELAGNIAAEVGEQPKTTPATGEPLDATNSSNTSLEPAPSNPNIIVYTDKTGAIVQCNTDTGMCGSTGVPRAKG